MSYGVARDALEAYRIRRIGSLLGEDSTDWFLSAWGSVKQMLAAFGSDEENKEVSETYATATHDEKVPPNMKLAYVCALRRDVRKQYASGDDGIYTDVTPFRHAVISAHGARLFDSALDGVLKRKGAGG